MSDKIYVLDTSILIHDPYCIHNFNDNDVVIPILVLEELDHLKSKRADAGYNARVANKVLRDISNEGNLNKGIELEGGGTLRVELNNQTSDIPDGLSKDIADNRILSVAISIQGKHNDKTIILLTKDFNLQVKARAVGVATEDYKKDKVDYDTLYTGVGSLSGTQLNGEFSEFQKSGVSDTFELPNGFFPNQILKLENIPSLGIVSADKESEELEIPPRAPTRVKVKKLQYMEIGSCTIQSINPRNKEQLFAMNLLMNQKIPLVTLSGRAGTGKTLLALLCGFHQIVEQKKYNRLIIARPIVTLGNELGYLPGSEREKLDPWMVPIYDNLEKFCKQVAKNKAATEFDTRGGEIIKEFESRGIIEFAPLDKIRGRSISNAFIIIDEAQNLTPHEIKTIVTRVDEGTKIVLTGDPEQIDNPYLRADSNGLTYLIEKMKPFPISAHITLQKGERSKLAELASLVL